MTQSISAMTLLVPDYDAGISFYVGVLGFDLIEDTRLSEDKRWVLVAPKGCDGTRLLLAKASGEGQSAAIGNQTGGRVFLFLQTDSFDKDYEAMKAAGVTFLEEPRDEDYGKVVVFQDPFGNKWDFIQPKSSDQDKPTQTTAKCAFLGLGVMGAPMAGWLANAGHDVTVWNRTTKKARMWAENHDGQAAGSAAEAVKDSDFVFMCLGDDPDVEAVFNSIKDSLKSGAIVVDHTTASPELARHLYKQCKDISVGFVDAPVSGGQAGAENGLLTVMAGGEEDVFARADSVMQAFAKSTTLIGGPGAGQLAKSVNQICIAGVVQGLAEAMNFADKADLDIAKVIAAISQGAAQSWQMNNRWETMSKGDYEFGFAVDWMRKDLRIAMDTANVNGADLTITNLVDSYYKEVQALGGGRWDTSSLLARLKAED